MGSCNSSIRAAACVPCRFRLHATFRHHLLAWFDGPNLDRVLCRPAAVECGSHSICASSSADICVAYQEAKKKYQATAKIPADSKFTQEDLDRGFNVSGLWSWSRHPNFIAEQLVWVTLYQWGCYATEVYINWTFAGVLGYLAVFQGSTWLTELLTARKYPEYEEYQRLVGRFFPKIWPSGNMVDTVAQKTNAKGPVKKTN